MSRRRWCAEQPALGFELDVGSCSHRVTWTRGRLVLHDHDLEAERVLRALGGEPCPCLLLLDACREPAGDLAAPQTRWLGPAGGSRPPITGAEVRQSIEQFQHRLAARPMPKERQDALLASMRRTYLRALLPKAMLDVLASAWEMRRERRYLRPRPRPEAERRSAEARLQEAAGAAGEEAMRRARRDLRPYATLTVECWKQPPGEPRLISGALDHAGGTLALTLPVSWLNRVWARGLAVVDGHLVLEVDRPAPAQELEARAIRWERRPAGHSTPVLQPCTVRRGPDREWALYW